MASCGMIYLPSSMYIGTGVQAILKFCPRNLRGYNVGNTVRSIYELLLRDEFRCHDMHTKFHKDWSGVQKLMGGIHIQTHRLEVDFITLLLVFKNKECRLKRKTLLMPL
jgi:hypothetical protein